MEKKSFLITEVLALLFGCLGIHRYYTGYIGLGIAQTLTLGGCGIWAFIDFLAKGQELEDYNKNIGIGFIIFVVVVSFIFTHSHSNNTVINNYSPKSSEKVEKTVVFGDVTCKVDVQGYSCNDILSAEDRAKLEQIQTELK